MEWRGFFFPEQSDSLDCDFLDEAHQLVVFPARLRFGRALLALGHVPGLPVAHLAFAPAVPGLLAARAPEFRRLPANLAHRDDPVVVRLQRLRPHVEVQHPVVDLAADEQLYLLVGNAWLRVLDTSGLDLNRPVSCFLSEKVEALLRFFLRICLFVPLSGFF